MIKFRKRHALLALALAVPLAFAACQSNDASSGDEHAGEEVSDEERSGDEHAGEDAE